MEKARKRTMKTILPYLLLWNFASSFLVILASMRSSQLSRQEEARQYGFVEAE